MSQRASGYALLPADRYATPAWVTQALLSVETFAQPVHEPASGEGHMVEAIALEYGVCISGDIFEGYDFLADKQPIESIVTNPPYSHGLADEFVRHALALTKTVQGKVAMLLPLAWDSAKNRRDIFRDHPAFKAKYILTRRIRWENLDQKENGPSMNHQWLVWDWRYRGEPAVRYLP